MTIFNAKKCCAHLRNIHQILISIPNVHQHPALLDCVTRHPHDYNEGNTVYDTSLFTTFMYKRMYNRSIHIHGVYNYKYLFTLKIGH